MALTPSEIELIEQLKRAHDARDFNDEKMLRYFQLKQRVEHLGMAIPPQMRRFLVVANWPRVVVRTISGRQKLRSLILPGEELVDPKLRAIAEANNLPAHLKMYRKDKLIYGRAFLSVGSNEAAQDRPIVRVESPREMESLVDVRRETMIAAARFYDYPEGQIGPNRITLYLPEYTVWVARDTSGRWVEVDRDNHALGVVPIIMGLNERMSGGFAGESELTDIIGLTDSVARALTNLQFAQEAHGVPGKWATGVSQGDFVDAEGKPVPQFEAYYDAMNLLANKDAKWGQFSAADLKNFETSLNIYGKQAAVSYGFPSRYFGITTSNPPAEGAIRADENDLVNYVEDKNEAEGMELGWMGALAYRFATGTWVEGNRVRTDYFDPGTPTFAQRADALTKMRAVGGISREGMWDELGWSEARKAKEREYMEAEQADPVLMALAQAGRADAANL